MAIPGFHAEASLHRSTSPYPTGLRRVAAGRQILPMWTEEQRWLLLECNRYYDSCESECTNAGYQTYEEWQRCNESCSQSLDACLATLYDGADS